MRQANPGAEVQKQEKYTRSVLLIVPFSFPPVSPLLAASEIISSSLRKKINGSAPDIPQLINKYIMCYAFAFSCYRKSMSGFLEE